MLKLFQVDYTYKNQIKEYSAIAMATCELMARAEVYQAIGDMNKITIINVNAFKHKVVML